MQGEGILVMMLIETQVDCPLHRITARTSFSTAQSVILQARSEKFAVKFANSKQLAPSSIVPASLPTVHSKNVTTIMSTHLYTHLLELKLNAASAVRVVLMESTCSFPLL